MKVSKPHRGPSPPTNAPEVVDTREAAAIVGLTPSTLVTFRSRGGGPPYCKIGRAVRYRVADLRAWRDAKLVRSTLETET